MSVAAAFFGMVGVALFGSSGLKDEFCKVYDPPVDETSNIRSVPCGYSQGFDLVRFVGKHVRYLSSFPNPSRPLSQYPQAIAGLTFSLLQALLFFFWMPHAAGSAKYEFSEVGKGFGEGAAEAPKASFAAVSSSGTSASGYQDVRRGGCPTVRVAFPQFRASSVSASHFSLAPSPLCRFRDAADRLSCECAMP